VLGYELYETMKMIVPLLIVEYEYEQNDLIVGKIIIILHEMKLDVGVIIEINL